MGEGFRAKLGGVWESCSSREEGTEGSLVSEMIESGLCACKECTPAPALFPLLEMGGVYFFL